jgi:ribose transport system substrate-binding protein
MKRLKKVLCVTLALATMVSISACGKSTTASNQDTSSSSKKKIVIGFSQCNTDSPYYVTLQDAAKKAAEAAGAEFRLVNAASNISKQNQDVQDLIQAGADIIILDPVNSTGMAPAVAAAKNANIPLVTVNRPVTEGATAHVGEDNLKMGQLVGEEALKLLGGKGKATGKILELMGSGGNQNTINRSKGFHDAFAGENVKFIQSPYCDFNRAKAVTAAQDLLQANPDVKLIYAHNDDMAIGGLQVATQNGMKVYVAGVDGLMEAVKFIQDGKYNVTTMNDPQLQGKSSVDTALKILKGEKVDSFVDVGTKVITKDNVKDYVGDASFATQSK